MCGHYQTTSTKTSWLRRLKAWCQENHRQLNIFIYGLVVYAIILGGFAFFTAPFLMLCAVIGLSIVTFIVAWLALCLRL
jgi:hypothetical protein